MKFFLLIFGLGLMIVILKYRGPLHGLTGDIAFAEKYLGMGGTNRLIVIIGILCFLIPLFYATGSLQAFLSKFVGGFFGQ